MYLAHYNDGKEKWQSHEVSLRKSEQHDLSADLYTLDVTDITGYGSTKEEAIDDFKSKLKHLINKYKELEALILYSNSMVDSIKEVDGEGNLIKEIK